MQWVIRTLWILLAVAGAARAMTYSTPDSQFADNCAFSASEFAKQHDGQPPGSWSDLESYLNRPVDEVFHYLTPTKRYAFVTPQISLPAPYEGDLLLITRRLFRDRVLYSDLLLHVFGSGLRETGRYIIYRRPSGEFSKAYVDEAYVQQAFRGTESQIPAPDAEPLRQFEVEARSRARLKWAITAAIVALLIWWWWAPVRRLELSLGTAIGRQP